MGSLGNERIEDRNPASAQERPANKLGVAP